jgi:lipocalin
LPPANPGDSMKKAVAILVVGAAALAACASIPRPGPVGNRAVPAPAKHVDLERYLGRWYEQFRYEASFEKGLEAVSAGYSMNADGSIRVVNTGRKGIDGKPKSATGKAKIVDAVTGAKLKVSFFGPSTATIGCSIMAMNTNGRSSASRRAAICGHSPATPGQVRRRSRR